MANSVDYEVRIKAITEGLASLQAMAKSLDDVAVTSNKPVGVGLNKLEKEAAGATQSSNALAGAISSIRNQLLSVVAVGGLAGLGKSIVDTAVQFDSIKSSLAVVTGSTEAAAAEFKFLQAESERLGVSIKDVSSGYVSLAAATKGTNLGIVNK